ncbi:MAG: aminotransferase class I/II-fold pyridoxal phosphate-dependent enzyme [Lachnospiraceae bacterium]|nr:aminotransferase class I/II-fold pyridoxal phosphate-dependent enzyme [Lachnospiraceae bacterium]MBR4992628.1 aminotransferase class I/II-fold pyridoxal phosphate-dependent enzyme [Lachnospiraceae bacterium]
MRHGGDIYRNKVNLDFSVNLNPLGTPESVLNAVKDCTDTLSVYPDIEQVAVKEAIADFEGVNPSEILAGNGASDLIMTLVRALNPKKALLYEPTFSGYTYALNSVECRTKHVIIRESEGFLITEDYMGSLDERADILFLCNPSNPTGRNIDESVLLKYLDKAKEAGTTVVLDESFYFLSDISEEDDAERTRTLIDRYKNLYIVRSLTKLLAMPGVRMGYVISDEANIGILSRFLPEWNLSLMAEKAIVAGMDVLKNTDFLAKTHELIKGERDYLNHQFMNMGILIFKSNAPFVLFKCREELAERLLSKGIMIRDCYNYPGLYKGVFRVAVKDRKSNEALVNAIKEIRSEEFK